MGRPKTKDLPDLTGLALPGAEIALRATPRAAQNTLILQNGQLRATVTAPPENGKANASIQVMLAKAMGVAPSHLHLLRGAASRDKVFVYSSVSSRN